MRVTYRQTIYSPRAALIALETLATRALDELEHAQLPALYSSGVRYARERPGENYWATPLEVLRRRRGDCEDLSAWRIAELRHTGADPNATFVIRDGGKPGLWHIAVRRGDGRIEDPSAVLGMKRG